MPRRIITVDSLIPTCVRLSLPGNALHDEFNKLPEDRVKPWVAEITMAQRNFRLLLEFASQYAKHKSRPAFDRLWELLNFYYGVFQNEDIVKALPDSSSGELKVASAALSTKLAKCRPSNARALLGARDLTCMSVGELALRLALDNRRVTHEMLYKKWAESVTFKSASGIPVVAFVGAAPGPADGSELIVTTSAESWTEVSALRNWCQASRSASLQQLDGRLNALGGTPEGNLLERMRQAHEDFSAFKVQGDVTKTGMPVFCKPRNLHTPTRWVATHSPGGGYEHCAAAGTPFCFTTWQPKARCGSCQACRLWSVPTAVALLETCPENNRVSHFGACAECSAVLVYRCLEAHGGREATSGDA